MFKTILKMKLVNPEPVNGCLREHIDFLKQKIDDMNSIKSNYNQKVVTIIEPIEEDFVTIKVESELELGVPGRAFTGLSRSLLNEKSEGFDPFYKDNVFHKRLFVFEKVYENEDVSEKISNTDLIVRTVVLANKPKSLLTQKEREILTQLKLLVANLPNTIDE